MANTAQARKRVRQADKHRLHNASQGTRLRSTIKKVRLDIENGEKDQAQQNFKQAVSLIDRAVKNGLIHKNKAARDKQRLHTRLKAVS